MILSRLSTIEMYILCMKEYKVYIHTLDIIIYCTITITVCINRIQLYCSLALLLSIVSKLIVRSDRCAPRANRKHSTLLCALRPVCPAYHQILIFSLFFFAFFSPKGTQVAPNLSGKRKTYISTSDSLECISF